MMHAFVSAQHLADDMAELQLGDPAAHVRDDCLATRPQAFYDSSHAIALVQTISHERSYKTDLPVFSNVWPGPRPIIHNPPYDIHQLLHVKAEGALLRLQIVIRQLELCIMEELVCMWIGMRRCVLSPS